MTNGTVITTTDYAGNYIYRNNALQFISQPEGYLELDGQGGYDYTYQYKDHLGNIRLSYKDISTTSIPVLQILEENNYYPFGLKHSGYNMLVFSANLALKYKYNGKELQDDLIGSSSLDLYDYGARFYDPALGRWHVLDPLAEDYYSWTTYNYVANNPIFFIDPDGRGWKEAKVLLKGSVTATFSIGAQVGVKVGTYSAKLNVMSYNFESNASGNTKSYASSDFSLGVGLFEVSKESTYTKESKGEIKEGKLNVAGNESTIMTKVKTDVETTSTTTSLNVGNFSVSTTDLNVKTSDNQGGKTDVNTSNIKVSAGGDVAKDILKLDVSAIVGVKGNIDLNKLWEGIKELVK